MIRELVDLVQRLNLSTHKNLLGVHFPEMVSLLSIVFNVDREIAFTSSHRLLNVACGDDRSDLVAPQVDESYGLEHFNAPHMPADGRFPQNGFEHRARCGWCDDVVGHTFDLHLGSGEAGKLA